MKKYETPLLDELEKGPFPSFVKEIKRAAAKNVMANDELGQLEYSYKTNRGYWKHGGIVGVLGYGGGIIGRYSMLPEMFPEVKFFHTVRVNQPSGWFYTTEVLRELTDICDKYGSGIMNFHGSTGDIIFLGTTTENLEPIFAELTSHEKPRHLRFDLGGSGSALRTPSACNGPARCEWTNYDTLEACHQITHEFQDEIHRPAFNYKFKFKFAGCACDCVGSIARSDCSVIGTWKGPILIDQDAVKWHEKKGMNIQKEIVDMCPTECISYDGKELKIDNDECVRCMHCIAKMHHALKPSGERGATICIGNKAPIVIGTIISHVIIPFMKMEPPFTELKELGRKIWDWWDEHSKPRERVGELIEFQGMRSFLEAIGVEPIPQMIKEPRRDPFFFFKDEDIMRVKEIEKEEKRTGKFIF
ncbi:MAG: dissimilatory-type sulfite reductase subunit alpha [Nitrospirota bacterium]|nr:dissimilatory-type sulfite reductase subunit alpha [Nitrospirota bacterium]